MNASVPEKVVVDGVVYTQQKTGNRAVVVVDRGWIFAGDVIEDGGRIKLARAVWVFRWESVGFAKVIEDPRASGADLRRIADVDLPADAEIFRVAVAPEWGLSCAK